MVEAHDRIIKNIQASDDGWNLAVIDQKAVPRLRFQSNVQEYSRNILIWME